VSIYRWQIILGTNLEEKLVRQVVQTLFIDDVATADVLGLIGLTNAHIERGEQVVLGKELAELIRESIHLLQFTEISFDIRDGLGRLAVSTKKRNTFGIADQLAAFVNADGKLTFLTD